MKKSGAGIPTLSMSLAEIFALNQAYAELFPDKMTIIMDVCIFSDVNHYKAWVKERLHVQKV